MQSWDCCRTCLNAQSLNPIFILPEHCQKYTEAIFNAAGIKVELNDNFPQEMCTTCIEFVNESSIFRRKADETQKILISRLEQQDTSNIVIKQEEYKIDTSEPHKSAFIVISDLDDFREYDNNSPLLDDKTGIIQNGDNLEFDAAVDDLVDKPFDVLLENNCKVKPKRKYKKRSGINVKKVKEKPVRIREEIECEVCHKILTSRLSVRNHYKIHTGFDVVCQHCGKKFISRRLLLMHCKARHGYEKTDKCSYCEYRGCNAEQVKIHERIHTGEKPYSCKDCSAAFHRKSTYLQHIAIHLPEKTIQCDQCPARFKSITLMRIHKNRHRAPQYSYRCRVCDNHFARRRNVTRHLQRIHGMSPSEQNIDKHKIS